jgi:hypothetical protein
VGVRRRRAGKEAGGVEGREAGVREGRQEGGLTGVCWGITVVIEQQRRSNSVSESRAAWVDG